jgi:uncharacterized protein YbaP (TraB family)
MKRFVILFLLIAAAASVTQAQQKNARTNYKLLWRISGNGLKAPSYLFGTMHVQDNKAFDFSDSVLLKISECEAFAMEFHPDSVTSLALSIMLQNESQEKNAFRKLLDPKEYNRLDSVMNKRTGYSLDKFKSPAVARFFLESKLGKKDKQTFLDAWLYNIARKQGKVMVGLEDGKQQFALLDKEPSKQIKELTEYLERDDKAMGSPYESFLDIYYKGDIDEIRTKSLASLDSATYDDLITRRNIGMANNIRKEIHEHTTFIAVGAAHLPGEEGLIRLLQSDGYKVTVVAPRFTGLAKKYKFDTTEEKWFLYTSDEGGYTIEMPQKPVPFKSESIPLTFQTYIDIGGPVIYQCTHIPVTSETLGKNSTEVLNKVESNIRRIHKLEKSGKVNVAGLEGRDITFYIGDQFFRARLIHRGAMIYMLMAGPSREAANSVEAIKFFSSFNPIPFRKIGGEEFVSKDGAFAVYMKGKVSANILRPENPEGGEKYKLNIFHATDGLTGEGFLIRYNDFPSGYVSSNDSLYYANMVDNLVVQMKGRDLSHESTDVLGFNGESFAFNIGGDSHVKGKMVLRGNRYYLLLSNYSGSSSHSADDFLNSFRFLSYQPGEIKRFDFPEGITLTVPATFHLDTTEEKVTRFGSGIHNIVDEQTGILYILSVEELATYDEENDANTFFEKRNLTYNEANDSIRSTTRLSHENYIAEEIEFVLSKTNAIKKIKTILSGRKVYALTAYLPADHHLSSLPEKFFNSFTINGTTSWNLFADKTDSLLADVSSPDSIVHARASSQLVSHQFDKADLPKIYKALNASYSDDGKEYGSVRSRLLSVLRRTNDETTIDFITELYDKLPVSVGLKDNALSVLASIANEKALVRLRTLFNNDPSKNKFEDYTICSRFYDSLQLLNYVLPDFLAGESKFSSTYSLFRLVTMALDSGALTADVKSKVVRQIIELGKRQTEQGLDSARNLDGLAGMFHAVPFTDEVKKILWSLHRSADLPTMMSTSVQLLKNGISVNRKDIEKIATDPRYRLGFYEMLKEVGHEKLYPRNQLSEEKFAESALWEYIESEEGFPEKSELVGIKKIRYNDEKQNLYVFKYKGFEDDSWYIGISGPYASGKFSERGEMTYSTYQVFENKKQVDEVVKDLLTEYKAELLD